MKFRFLGTAAAEGIPALWCRCERCVRSRTLGGRAVRTRSQAIVDDTLLIDFPSDTYKHFLDNRLDLTAVTDCIITHSHSDHLYATDLSMLAPGFSHVQEGYHLSIFGTDKVGEKVLPAITAPERQNLAHFTEIHPFETFSAGKYTVTALPSIHDPNAGPVFYMIENPTEKNKNGQPKTILYAHDTHYFRDDVWEYFSSHKVHFDLVSLDCTNACLPLTYVGHMGLHENVLVRERMYACGFADEDTLFFCNHFSHNGISVVYDDFVLLAAKEGFSVSYDGMIVEF
ncbi:MAG: hypothetical protein J6I50_00490 [Clostridia bacterium]|nr:hypothetical protein [Clostridia bacterium]